MKKVIILIIISFVFMLIPITIYAGKGCCSYHGGLSYCDTSVGRWVCNDGTYSPSCRCYNEEIKEEVSQNNDTSYIDDNNVIVEDKKDKKDYTIASIVVGIISWLIIQKSLNKPIIVKNKIVYKIFNMLANIFAFTFLWIVIPFILGLKGYFILEILSIFIILIIVSIEN